MEFEQLKQKIEQLKKANLVGVKAHQVAAPPNRIALTTLQIPKNAKKAGVLVLIYPDANNNTHILLTKRASYKGTHSNQISFPGGKKENKDSNLEQTALRETYEEIGIKPTVINIVKQLTSIYIPPSNFKVYSFVGIIYKTPVFNSNYEVQEIIELPLKHLFDNKNLRTIRAFNSYTKNIDVPCFTYKEHEIWGATAMILNEIKEVLKNV